MNNQTSLLGLFKRTYGDSVIELYKNENPILDSTQFENKIGEDFDQPVDLTLENAFTQAVNTTQPSGSAYGGYIQPISGVTARALVTPFSIHGRASVTYNAISEAAGKGDKAFAAATGHIVKRMGRSHAKRLEIQLIHGRRGLCEVESVSGSSTTRSVVITAATASEGMWAGLGKPVASSAAGARLDVYTSARVKETTQTSTIDVVSYTPATRTLLVNGTDAAGGLQLISAGDFLYFETVGPVAGAANTGEMPGFKFWANNTSTLFNIDASQQLLWTGNVNASTGTPTLATLIDALTAPSSYGLMNATTIAIVPPRAFNVMVSDQSALRRYNAAEKTGKNGFSYLEFNVQTGTLRLQPHAYQHDGSIDMFCPDSVKRIGSVDMTFIQQSGGEEKLILQSADSPGAEMRTLSNQTLFCEMPRHLVSLTGVTY